MPNMPNKRLIDLGSSGPNGWSRLARVLQCPRAYALDQQREREDSDATVKGSLVHVGLAHHYARKAQPDLFYEPAKAMALVAQKNAETSTLWMDHLQLATDAVDAYVRHYAVDPWVPLAVEKVLKVRIGGYLYTQRADLICRHERTGKVHIVDHKTTYRISSGSVTKYLLDGQFLGYELIGRSLYGDKWGGTHINFIGLTNGFDFQRPKILGVDAAVEDFRSTVIRANEIREEYDGQDAKKWPATYHQHACVTQYGRCDHFDFCRYGA